MAFLLVAATIAIGTVSFTFVKIALRERHGAAPRRHRVVHSRLRCDRDGVCIRSSVKRGLRRYNGASA